MVNIVYIFTPIHEKYISRALYTLHKFSEPGTFRVILIDQTKHGFSSEVMNYISPLIDLYIHPVKHQLGYAGAMNQGIALALRWKVPYICLANDDIEFINKRWIQGIWDTFAKNPERIVGVCPMSPRHAGWGYGVPGYPEVLPYKEEYTEEEYDYLLKGDFTDKRDILPKTFPVDSLGGTMVDGAVFVLPYFKREIFEEVGFLDERFFPGCFLPDEKVMMSDYKYKAIKNVKKNDEVITHLGNTSSVKARHKKHYEGKVLELSFVGTTETIKLTPDHKVFHVSKGKGKRSLNWSRKSKVITETEARNLKVRDLMYFPSVGLESRDFYSTTSTTSTTLPYTSYTSSIFESIEAFRIYGYFLAEGNYIKKMTKKGKKDYGLMFSFHIKEKEYVAEVVNYFKKMGVPARVYDRPAKTISTVEVYSKDVAKVFRKLFGEYSDGKFIHSDIMKANLEALRHLVIAYSNGDGGLCKEFKKGHSKKDYVQMKMKSCSSQLLTDIRNILLKLGIPSLLYIKTKVKQRARKPAHELYISQNYLNRLYKLPQDSREKAPRNEVLEEGGKIYYPIKEIKEFDYKGNVYDLEVYGEHSYIVNTMAVHNSGEDMDFMARVYQRNKRIVSTSLSWIWHHWTKSKDLFASGELEDKYYKPREYWNNLGDLWRPQDNEGHTHDPWGHWTDEKGQRHLLNRVPDIFVDII